MLLTWLQQTPGWVLPGASLDLNFAAGTYYPSGVDSLITVTRAQTVTSYALTSTGTLTAFAANTPRITDLGLLVEQAATNLCLQSQTFDNSSWAKTNASVTANAVTAPDGTLTADKLVENSANGFHQVTQSITVVSATTYTWCQYLEAGERTGYSISLSGATTTGIIINGLLTGAGTATVAQGSGSPSATITAVSNGFYRIVITFTTNATALTVAIRLATDGAGNTFYTGDGTSGYYIWQADLVALAFATSPIPTTTVAVARAADVVTFNSLNLPAPYSLFFSAGSSAKDSADLLLGGTVNDGSLLRISGQAGVLNVVEAGVTTASVTNGTMTIGTPFKMAGRFAVNDANVSMGGSIGTHDTSTIPPTLTALGFGRALYSFGSGVGSVYFTRTTVYRDGRTDAQLRALTA